jgi:transmembrane sensor
MEKRPIPIEQACNWMARLLADDVSDNDHKACNIWRNAAPENENAWQQVNSICTQFDELPDKKIGSRILNNHQSFSRRRLLTFIGVSLGIGVLGSSKLITNVNSDSDYLTQTGEISEFKFDDGTRLILNTATAVDFDQTTRKIRLHEGEIWVSTGQHATPLTIYGQNGKMIPIGTEFSVRQFENNTRLCVYQGRVKFSPSDAPFDKHVVGSGKGVDFDSVSIKRHFKVNTASKAWIDKKLAVSNMLLTDFIEELSRYRVGKIKVSLELSKQRVTGVFSLENTDNVLFQLSEILPLSIQYITPWWVSLSAR